MKKIIALITAIAAIFASCSKTQNKTSVWKVTNGQNVVYLGGSVHILRQQDLPFPSAFDKAFDKADILVFETDIDAISNRKVAERMLELSKLEDGKTIKEILSPETYKMLVDKCNEFSFPIAMIEHLKPMMAMQMLESLKHIQLGMTANGADVHYNAKAKKEGKVVEWFETIDFQMNLLCNLGAGKEDEIIKYSLNDFDKIDKELPNMISEWREGKTTAENEMKEMKEKYPDIYNNIICNRNKNWLPKIEEYLKSGKTAFVIVGAGHMWGEDGLLNLLKQKGYKIEQM